MRFVIIAAILSAALVSGKTEEVRKSSGSVRVLQCAGKVERGPTVEAVGARAGPAHGLADDLRGALEQLTVELGLQGRVCFAGARNQDQVAEELRAASLFLLPSVAEALPVVLMEAGAVGLPVVCTDVGSVRELVQDGVSGFVVPPRDVEQMSSALERLLLNPGDWPAYGRAGRAHIERHYDIEALNDRLEALCRELAGPRR